MIYIIIFFTSILAGLGIGGGSFFIMISTFFSLISYKEAVTYSLSMFIVIGITNTIRNFNKKELFNKKIFLKTVIFVCLGSIVGSNLGKSIDENNLKLYFYIFMIILGIYEIISSLKNYKKLKL